jgi:large subunit ribosomal protein L21
MSPFKYAGFFSFRIKCIEVFMYALVEYKGKQYKAEKGAILQVDKIEAEKGATIDIDSVLLVSDGDKISVGTPFVKGAKVKVVVEDSFRDKKVLVFKYKSKKDYHRFIGHRQQYTNVRVEEITVA